MQASKILFVISAQYLKFLQNFLAMITTALFSEPIFKLCHLFGFWYITLPVKNRFLNNVEKYWLAFFCLRWRRMFFQYAANFVPLSQVVSSQYIFDIYISSIKIYFFWKRDNRSTRLARYGIKENFIWT